MFAKTLLFLFCVTSLVLTGQAGLPKKLEKTQINMLSATPPNVSAEPRCILPQHPENGAYEVINMREARPSQGVVDAELEFTCMPGYALVGTNTMMCRSGVWSNSMPECLPLCEVEKQTSNGSIIVYRAGNAGTHRCLVDQFPVGQAVSCSYIPASGSPNRVSSRMSASLDCEVPEHPTGGIYTVQNEPDVFPGAVFDSLNLTAICDYGYTVYKSKSVSCTNGQWSDDLPTCDHCGIPFGSNVVLSGRIARGKKVRRNKLPWHAGIYAKTSRPYEQICGGSLVTNTVVISAAHCFWSDVENLLPASQFAVAVGKLYRAWDDSRDTTAQMSDVKNIILPDRYQGNMAKFQDDIALVIVNRSFVYGPAVLPVCLNFDHVFMRSQLKELSFGTVAGWGLTANGNVSEVLLGARLPYIPATDCIRDSSPGFAAYITSDKLCAGYTNGTAVCRGDSGGGLAFPVKLQNGSRRYYLRGIASTAPPGDEGECNIYTWATFTNLYKHQDFITDNLERNVA